MTRRRVVLLVTGALVTSACAPPSVRPPARVTVARVVFEPWRLEAQGMLSDVLNALRTFDSFQAFRVATAADSSRKLTSELAWDPPTTAAWDEATHVTRGLNGRAQQLFQAVTTAQLDPSLWREQRDLADATHDLVGLSDVLAAYRDQIDHLPPGDAVPALSLLDRGWAQWDAVAARWGTSRAAAVMCRT
jgi:hypothetical protein